MGISRATFNAATRGLEPDMSLPDLIIPGRPERPLGRQAEFVQAPADYIKKSSIERLAGEGRKLLNQNCATLDAIEKQFGVPGPILLAIWDARPIWVTQRIPAARSACWRPKPTWDGARTNSGRSF